MNLVKDAEKIIGVLKERQKKVLIRRFGLLGSEKATLAKIGGDINRTRERIRQIEAAALKELEKEENQELIAETQKRLKAYVDRLGGVVVEREIVPLVMEKRDQEKVNALSLLLTILPELERTKKNQTFLRYWFNRDCKKKDIEEVADKYEQILKKAGQPIAIDRLLSRVGKTGFEKKRLISIFNIKRSLGKDKQGRVGLMKWFEINPKSARDKAYLVLKEDGEPLHYRMIAKKIREESFYSKHNPTAPTVHNEVILDKRFVLIGRGIYALKEWGYQPGTVQDVIVNLLKKNTQGLSREEIIKKVLEQRQVARNTIMANLNQGDTFQKKGENRYQVK